MNDQQQSPPGYDELNKEKTEKEQKKVTEKAREDSLNSLAWALILIWAGLVFLASNLGWLDSIQVQRVLPEGFEVVSLGAWSLIALGAGVILLVEALIRTFIPAYRSSTTGSYILAAIFLGIGLSNVFGWQLIGPLILIGLGLAALANALISHP